MSCEHQECVRSNEVLAGVRAATRAATSDIADEVTTPFRVWSASFYLCALQVRLLDSSTRVDSAAVALCEES